MLIFERSEGDTAIIENDEEYIKVPMERLPVNVREGDVLLKSGDDYTVSIELTRKRREEIKALQDSVWE